MDLLSGVIIRCYAVLNNLEIFSVDNLSMIINELCFFYETMLIMFLQLLITLFTSKY